MISPAGEVHDFDRLALLQPFNSFLCILEPHAEQLPVELDGGNLVAAAHKLSKLSELRGLPDKIVRRRCWLFRPHAFDAQLFRHDDRVSAEATAQGSARVLETQGRSARRTF